MLVIGALGLPAKSLFYARLPAICGHRFEHVDGYNAFFWCSSNRLEVADAEIDTDVVGMSIRVEDPVSFLL